MMSPARDAEVKSRVTVRGLRWDPGDTAAGLDEESRSDSEVGSGACFEGRAERGCWQIGGRGGAVEEGEVYRPGRV